MGELSRYRIDGAISALAIRSAKAANRLERLGIPIAAVNSKRFGAMRVVSTANRAMGSTAANALIERGCRKLGYLAGRDNPSQRDRQRGYFEQIKARGLPAPEVVTAGFTYEEGHAAAIALLSSSARPDGVFCVNDLVAIGALDAIRIEFGLRVPDDIQVIGCDDIPMARWKQNNLSTFKQDMSALGEACVDLLQDDTHDRARIIASHLIARGTTRP